MRKTQIKYVELLTIAIEQLFYRNQVCKSYRVAPALDLEITPISDCEELMKRMNLVFRRNDQKGCVIVLARVEGETLSGHDLLRFPAEAGDKLTFGIILKNSSVFTQNELPMQASDSMYFFTNQANNSTASRDALDLSNDPTGVTESDLLKISTINYKYHVSHPVAAGSAIIRHQVTGKTIQPKSLISQEGETDLFFNLISLPSGKCELLIQNVIKDTFYFTGSVRIPAIFGIVEILLSPSIASNYRVVKSDRSLTTNRPKYRIVLRNRKTIWRYIFQLHPNSPLSLEMSSLNPAEKATFLSNFNIVTNDPEITFKQTKTTDYIISFESESTLLLKEAYFVSGGINNPLKLMLSKNIGKPNEVAVKDNLPYPSTKLIDSTESPVIYSEAFLTI